MSEIEVYLYRKQNPDGTSKDWAYPLDLPAEALIVYYGRTGSVLRSSQTPQAACKKNSPHEEAQERAYQKRQKGYRDLGHYRLDAQRRVLTPIMATPTPSASAARVRQPGWYWRWTPQDDDATVHDTLDVACLAVTTQLRQVNWPPPAGQTRWGGKHLDRLWSVHDRAKGWAWTPQDSVRIAVFWLLLSRTLPGLRLYDHTDQPITHWPTSIVVSNPDRVRLQQLGLLPVAWQTALPEATWFY